MLIAPLRDNIISIKWWRMTGSNRRPPACKAGALPAELILRVAQNAKMLVLRQEVAH